MNHPVPTQAALHRGHGRRLRRPRVQRAPGVARRARRARAFRVARGPVDAHQGVAGRGPRHAAEPETGRRRRAVPRRAHAERPGEEDAFGGVQGPHVAGFDRHQARRGRRRHARAALPRVGLADFSDGGGHGHALRRGRSRTVEVVQRVLADVPSQHSPPGADGVEPWAEREELRDGVGVTAEDADPARASAHHDVPPVRRERQVPFDRERGDVGVALGPHQRQPSARGNILCHSALAIYISSYHTTS